MHLTVFIISLLSLVSFEYALNLTIQEIRSFRMVTQPFGGGLDHISEHGFKLVVALFMLSFSLLFIAMSAALFWLSLQPALQG